MNLFILWICRLWIGESSKMSKKFTIPWPLRPRPQSRERKTSGGRRSTCAIISLLVGLLFLLKVSERMSLEESKEIIFICRYVPKILTVRDFIPIQTLLIAAVINYGKNWHWRRKLDWNPQFLTHRAASMTSKMTAQKIN